MSKMYTQASMPSHECGDTSCGCNNDYAPDLTDISNGLSYSTSREVIQQFTSGTSQLECMFTVETTEDDTILLKVFDNGGYMVSTPISYDTAHKLQTAISDAMDELEATLDVNF